MKQFEPNPFPAIFMLAGSALLIGGCYWVYRPAALIAGGLLLMAWAFLGRRGGAAE